MICFEWISTFCTHIWDHISRMLTLTTVYVTNMTWFVYSLLRVWILIQIALKTNSSLISVYIHTTTVVSRSYAFKLVESDIKRNYEYVAFRDSNRHFAKIRYLTSSSTRLIIRSSFGLTFWTRTEIGSDCSHFQLDSSWVAHIFNPTRLDPTGNWVNSTRPAKDPSLASRGLNIEIFPVFDFCITFLHYLLIGSHEGEHEGRLIGSHDGEHGGEHEGSHGGEHRGEHRGEHEGEHREEHREKHRGETWRPFDFGRESWRENMVESHEGESCRLFDQAIYTYLISCRVGSGFRVGLSSQASQPDLSSRIQLLNPTRHFSKKIPTRPDAVSLPPTPPDLLPPASCSPSTALPKPTPTAIVHSCVYRTGELPNDELIPSSVWPRTLATCDSVAHVTFAPALPFPSLPCLLAPIARYRNCCAENLNTSGLILSAVHVDPSSNVTLVGTTGLFSKLS